MKRMLQTAMGNLLLGAGTSFPSAQKGSGNMVIHSEINRTIKKWMFVLLSILGTYSSISQVNCTIEPKFEWKHDSLNCKKIWFINYSQPVSPNNQFTWKFGDGSSSNEFQPSHEYSQPGTYTVCLVLDAGNNCIKEVCQTIQVNCDPCSLQLDFKYEKESSQPNRVYFLSLFAIPPGWTPQFFWNFGDGGTSDIYNPTHTYANPGTYTVCLKLYLSSTCFKEICKTIVIGDSCNLELKWHSETDPGNPRRIKFFNETIVPTSGADYKWSFGDGTGSADKEPVHIYEKPGEYKVCLKVAISNTCIRELCKTITVDTPCRLEAKFEHKIDSVQKNKVYFINGTISNQSAIHYLWKFGDGSTSNEVNPIHYYQQPGIYEVCLVAETENSCRSVYCSKFEIRTIVCHIEPKFEWKASQEEPRKIYFKNLSIVPVTGAKYLWKFGDGTTSTEKDPVHKYEKPGEYEVCLIVELDNLCRKVSCLKIVIRKPDCDVHAKFEWKQDAQNARKLWFANTSQPVSNIWRTYWSYGDGTTSQDFNSFHEYGNPGKYYVCLKVLSLNGCSDYYCDSVFVGRKDTCENRSNFKWEPTSSYHLELKFKPEYINTTWKYNWKFGDGTGSTAVTPVHKFEKPGIYNACLMVIQGNGCKTTICKEVNVGPACENFMVKFEYKRENNRPNKISFVAAGTQQIVKQKWIIKRDGTINGYPYVVVLHQNNPTFIFPFAGWYTVCLEATNANGCIKQYCQRINIERVVMAPGSFLPLSLTPNPTRNTAKIHLKLENNTAISITLMDEGGSVKSQWQVSGQKGNNTINLPVDKLAQGQYLVQLVYGNQVQWAKFQKM